MKETKKELSVVDSTKMAGLKKDQPQDGVLRFELAPEMLKQSIFFDADKFGVYDRTQIDEVVMIVCSDLLEERGDNYIRKVGIGWSEETEPDATQQEIEDARRFSILVELKVGAVYVTAEFGPYPTRYSYALDQDFEFRANSTFIRAAGLIGIAASIGIAIDEAAA